ncbi:MAG: hypothetical protein ACRDK7_09940 [Solirubrobacteraceae bacterium]
MSSEETFDLSAAGLRADGTDLRISVEVLAAKLESSLPGRTRVQRRGGGLMGRGEKHVREIQVKLGSHGGAGGDTYTLSIDGDRVEGFRERKSGGIAIRREPLDPDAWIAALTEKLQAEAQRSAEARAALEGLVR